MTTNLLGYIRVADVKALEDIQTCLKDKVECTEHFDEDSLEVWVTVCSEAIETLMDNGFLRQDQKEDIERLGVETILFYS